MLLPLEDHRQAHERQHYSLEPRVLGQQNSNITHEGNVADHTTHNIGLAVQEVLATRVEFSIVCCVVVAFGQELEGRCFGTVVLRVSISLFRTLMGMTRLETTYPLPPPNLLTTLCTMGISLPLTLYTTTSPTFVS